MMPSRVRSEVFDQNSNWETPRANSQDFDTLVGTAEESMNSRRSQDAEVRRDVQVRNPTGMHMRMCSALVTLADRYEARVTVHKDGRAQGADSILGLMSLGVNPGDWLRLTAEGPDAEEAMEACAALFDRRDF